MQVQFASCLALEVQQRQHKEKTYSNLIVFEFGQRFPQVRALSLAEDQIEAANKLVGKRCNITANLYEREGRNSLAFVSAA